MDLLFVMDPPERVQTDRDTTYALMAAAAARGHRTFTCTAGDVWLGGKDLAPWAMSRPILAPGAGAPFGPAGPAEERAVAGFPVVWIRPDPPFDESYLELTWMLERTDRKRSLLINDPAGIRGANEKLYALHFPEVCPPSLVSSDPRRLQRFVEEVGEAVLKPLSGHGGEGILFAWRGMRGLSSLVETAVALGCRCEAQAYLPDADRGDKRILLLDGEPLGAVLRVHAPGEERNNLHLGGSPQRAVLDDSDRRVIDAVRERLRRDGLVFVGLDVIGGKLTEVNVTSPTGIQELERIEGPGAAARVIAWCEEHAPGGAA